MHALFLLAILTGGDGRDWGVDFKVESTETIRRTLRFAGPPQAWQLRLDNFEGDVVVTGYDGQAVELVAKRTVRAETQDKLQQALRDVPLNVSEKESLIDVLVETPWRCQDGGWNYRGPRFYGYRVRYDFEIKLPRQAGLYARTVNNGRIQVERLDGRYDVENTNGRVELSEIGGPGRARTINGGVRVVHRSNPKEESSFSTLNGKVEVYFQPGLSADLHVKTFNGSIYTDFPVSYLPLPPATPERRDGRLIYRGHRHTAVRIGAGGPVIRLDSFNGSVHILERGKQL